VGLTQGVGCGVWVRNLSREVRGQGSGFGVQRFSDQGLGSRVQDWRLWVQNVGWVFMVSLIVYSVDVEYR